MEVELSFGLFAILWELQALKVVTEFPTVFGTFFIKRLKKRREPVYLASPPCSSRCGECSSEGSLLRSARDLAIRHSELDTLVRRQDLDETFV